MRLTTSLKKTLSVIATLATIFNSLGAPITVIAQEITPEPTPAPTEEPTPAPSAEETLVPTESPTATPEVTPEAVTPTPEVSAEPTPATEEATPTPESLPEVQDQSNENVQSQGPPSESPTVTPSAESTPTITPVQPEEDGSLTAQILETSLFSESLQENPWFQVITDKLDYAPTEAAVITGTGFTPGETYSLTVSSTDEPATSTTVDVTADSNGSFTYIYQLDGIYRPNYLVEVKESETLLASTTFTDGNVQGSYNLDQAKNGGIGNTAIDPVEWTNQNLNGSHAHYKEGESVPYRVVLSGLPTGVSNTVKIEWDIRQSSKNALDYITSPQRITESVDPTAGIVGLGSVTYWAIPTPTANATRIASFNALPSGEKNLWAYNVSSLTFGSYVNGSDAGANTSTSITITFTPTNSTVVLAWGGHIASEADWGAGNGATALPGSPYHTRILELCNGTPQSCGGGNQDRSLAAGAVIPPSTIIIRKETDPIGGLGFGFTTTGLTPSTFSLDGGGSRTFLSVIPGSYSVVEDNPSPYSLTGISCTDTGTGTIATTDLGTRSVAITIGAAGGGNVDCTFTNTLQNGHLIVQKTTVPSGDQTNFTINATGSGTIVNGAAGTISDSSDHDYEVTTGTYYVAETIPSGWSKTSDTCQGVSVPAGETVYCQITNTKLGSIVVEKQTAPDAATGNFTFTGTASGTISDNGQITVNDLLPGQYTSTETDPTPAFDLTSIVCNDTNSAGVLGTRTATFNVAAGESVKCTFTNTQRGSVSGQKYNDLNGNGSKDSLDSGLSGWTIRLMNETGNAELANTTTNGSGNYSFSNIAPGNYQVCEDNQTDWSNTDPGSGLATPACKQISVTAGQNTVSDFGNFQCAVISGTKWEDLNGNGQKDPGEPVLPNWTINLSGPQNSSTTTNIDGNYSFKVCSGGSHTVSETFPNNDWYQTYPGGASPNHQVDVTSGGSFTGKDFGNARYAKIYGYKYRDNDGDGNLDADDLLDTLEGWVIGLYDGLTDLLITTTNTDQDGYYEFTGLLAGSAYYVLEELKPGWTQTYGPTPTPTPITIQSNDQTKIEFANYENVSITVCKLEDADGDKDGTTNDQTPVQGWSMTLYDDAVQVGSAQLTGENGCYTWTDLGPGNYSVTEETRTGWTNLDNNTSHGFGTLLSGSGDHSWTFVNTRLGKVIVKKVMVGGTGSFEFTGDVSGTISANEGTLELDNVIPGQDKTSEEADEPGWVLTDVTCDDSDSLVNIPARTVIFRVASAETVTCTFTNSKLPTLTLGKTVITDDGGDAVEADFQGKINGVNVPWDQPQTLSPGSYTASETGVDTYTPSDWGTDCAKDGSVTLEYGDNKVCSITNDDIAPTLKLVKSVEGASPGGWELTATGNGGFTDFGDSTIFHDVRANTSYILTESNVEGYSQSGVWQCDGGTLISNTLTLDVGDEVTCTVTNTRDTGSLRVHKKTDINGNGDWGDINEGGNQTNANIFANNAGFRWTLDGGADQTFGTLLTGLPTTITGYDHTVDESIPSGYHFVGWYKVGAGGSCLSPDGTDLDFNVPIVKNQTTTVVICNQRDTGKVTVVKNAINDSGVNFYFDASSGFPGGDFELEDDGNPFNGGTPEKRTFTVPTGSYWINERDETGWKLTGLICEGDDNSQINLETGRVDLDVDKGEEITCTYENTELGKVTGFKFYDQNANGHWFFEPFLNGWKIFIDLDESGTFNPGEPFDITSGFYWFFGWHQLGAYSFNNLLPGTYSLCEELEDGWTNTTPLCRTVEISPGDTDLVNFGNIDYGSVTVTKFNDANANGDYDDGEETLSDWTINLGDTSKDTNENGVAQFDNVISGNYDLDEELKDGWAQTAIYCNRNEDISLNSLDLIEDTEGYSVYVPAGQNVECFIGNFSPDKKIGIEKTNDSPSTSAGATVTYTLVITNNGNVPLTNVIATDILPGGFSYVSGSTTGATTSDPTISGPNLSWSIPGTLAPSESFTISYKVTLSGDLGDGTYTNIAGCTAEFDTENIKMLRSQISTDPIACEDVTSNVTIGSGVSFGGRLGQVLGISTELPATGSPTALALVALGLIGVGFILKKKYVKN